MPIENSCSTHLRCRGGRGISTHLPIIPFYYCSSRLLFSYFFFFLLFFFFFSIATSWDTAGGRRELRHQRHAHLPGVQGRRQDRGDRWRQRGQDPRRPGEAIDITCIQLYNCGLGFMGFRFGTFNVSLCMVDSVVRSVERTERG
jgi:hypothetical protein